MKTNTQSIQECLDATNTHLKVVRRVQRQVKLPKRLAAEVTDVVAGMEITLAKLKAAATMLTSADDTDHEPVVVVEVQGGLVQEAYANSPVRVIVRDYDNIAVGDANPVQGRDLDADQTFHAVPLN